ncbi:MAG: aldolase/citrate lyase family protein [Bacteriovoracia bacterium]
MIELMAIENDPQRAKAFEAAGVDRIFIDLELLGKHERQGHLNTVISNHKVSDIQKVRASLLRSKVLVRINPWNANSAKEIDEVIHAGAQVVMLPMFKTKHEVVQFIAAVGGRARTCLLLETPQAAMRIDEILQVPGIDEIHIGLNDLQIALGLEFMMEMYLGPFLEGLTSKIQQAGISLGIGGIAPLDGGAIPGRLVLTEAYRLGSRRFILSRAFPKEDLNLFTSSIQALRSHARVLESYPVEKFIESRKVLVDMIAAFRDRSK